MVTSWHPYLAQFGSGDDSLSSYTSGEVELSGDLETLPGFKVARPVDLECPQKDLCTQGHPGREMPTLISVGGNRYWVLELEKGLHLACCVALRHGEMSRSSGTLKNKQT